MAVKIYVQVIFPENHPGYGEGGYATMNAGMEKVYRKVLRPDTELDIRFVPRSTLYTSHAYLEAFNNIEIIKGVIGAEADGADVAFIRCGNDPAIRESREAVEIPVIGITEAAMHLACQMGSRFGVVGLDEKSLPLVERNIKLFGLESKAVAHRPVRMPTNPDWMDIVMQGPKWFGDPDYVRENVVPHFDAAAKTLIDDGAEVIVTGCAAYAALTLAGHTHVTDTVVPIVESVAIGIKQAEMMGDLKQTLGLSHSKHLTYQSYLTTEQRDGLIGAFEGAGRNNG